MAARAFMERAFSHGLRGGVEGPGDDGSHGFWRSKKKRAHLVVNPSLNHYFCVGTAGFEPTTP